ncbi:Stage III sporulation protein AC/AD protein family protein [Caloramator mitchellensis]|uniref:Stage III sporulation protein AC/AD protein family protein n=1 Tax=Caloramator mitchellensis TaxID=908809 RepID=A0A0R3JTP0_CALMK|nr:stage III sporulation protein AD [Caloramator mitchellensis]KRQ86840.1 Stage III sporulation protein AC/AD protein family protein [Caloramator mitchellensis]
MDITKVIIIAFIATIIILVIKEEKPELAIQISMVTGLVIFFFMISRLTLVIQALQQIAIKANIDYTYLNIIFKIIGIAYLASFGVEICKDSGQGSLANKIEFAGKILIIILSIPILMAVMDLIIKILP